MKIILKILSFTIIIGLLFSLLGCGSIAKKIAEEAKIKISEKLEETEQDSPNDIDEDDAEEEDITDDVSEETDGDSTAITTSSLKSMAWPKDSMGDIKPVSCKITAVFTEGKNGSVAFEGMERAEADQYIEDFESMGFTKGMATEDENGVLFIKSTEAGDSVMFSYTSEGTGLITFSKAE